MMKKLLLLLMMLAFALPPAWAGLQTVTINRNEGQFEEANGVYYCYKSGLMMTFTSGMNNPNYLVEHQQVYFEVRSVNPEYIIKKIVFHCVDNTTSDNLDCFYWGPSTISIVQNWTYPNQPGTYRHSGYTGTWTGTTNKIQFTTMAKPVRFGSVDITFEKETGDIFELVTNDNQLQAGQKYAIVNQYYPTNAEDEGYAMSTLMNESYNTIGRTKVSFVPNTNKHKVIINDETRIITLQTGTNVDERPWYLGSGSSTVKMRRASSQTGSATSAKGYPLSFENIGSYPEFFPVKIEIGAEADNYPAKIRFCDNSANYNKPTDTNYAIGHNNTYEYFKVLDITSTNSYASTQRVHLYRPAQNYIITTELHPVDGGEITLTDGVLEVNGDQTSQEFEEVSFFVSVNDGYAIQSVTVTDANNNPVSIQCTQTTLQGNRYTFTMPAANVNIVVNYVEANYHLIHTECDPAYGGEYTFSSGTFDANNEVVSYPNSNVTFSVAASLGYVFTGITATSEDGQSTVLPLTDNGDGTYSFTMPDNDVTLSSTFDRVIGDIFDLVTSGSQIVEGATYIIVTQNHDKVMMHWDKDYNTFQGAPIVEWVTQDKSKVRVDDNACFFRMEDLVVNTSNNYRSAYMNTLVGYLGYDEYNGTTGNVVSTPELSGYNRATMYISGASGGEKNYMCTFDSIKTANRTIRYEVATNSFKIINYGNSSDERVWLYKLDESYYNISTLCTPEGGGTITVSATSERENQPVTFTVTPNAGYTFNPETGVTVTYTDGTTGAISVNYDENTGIYSFTMPDNAVTITANFDVLPEPYNIIPNCVPAQGGYMNINGHGNNETTSSLPGSTVNFEVHTNWGYRISSVTAVNSTTGETVDLTLTGSSDAGNNYTFTMPVGEVYITAKFYQNLFLLGTAMGRTTWCAAGPEFTFDESNDEYYLDVYFKGMSASDPYNLFNLATATDIIDWTNRSLSDGNWGAVQGRLFAETYNKDVGNGSTATLYGSGHNDMSFRIHAGVYRIKVNHAMNEMTITQIYPTMSFAPVSNSTVQLGTEVHITSDLQSIVHEIAQRYGMHDNQGGPCEQNAMFYSTTNNWADQVDQELEGTVTITQIGTTTVKSSAAIGQITVDGEAVYNVPNYYDIHTVVTPEGAATITVESSEMAGETVNFTVSNPNTGFENYTLYAVTVTNETTGEVTTLPISGSGNYSFTMPESAVTITADFRTLNNVTATWTPFDGGEVTIQPGDVGTYFHNGETVTFTVTTNSGYEITSVSITSGGSAVNYSDNGDGTYTFTMPENSAAINVVFTQPIQYYTAETHWNPQEGGCIWLNGSNEFNQVVSFTEGSTVEFTVDTDPHYRLTEVVVTNTTTYAELCYPEPDANNVYTFEMPAQNVYIMALFEPLFDITKQVTPDGAGVITAPESSIYNETVNFSVVPNPGYILNSVTVTKDGNHQTVTVTDNGGGNYSFTMPEADVTVAADFTRVYDINTVCNPPEGGSIGVVGDADSSVSGGEIEFNVNINEGYALSSVVVTDATGETVDCNYNNGTYSFTMPESDVTITATFGVGYHVVTLVDPEYSAQCNVYWSAYPDRNIFAENTPMTVEVMPELGYVVDRITLTNNTTEQVAELSLDPNNPNMTNFVMPNSDVTVTVYLNTTSLIFRLVTQVEQIIEGKTYTFVSQQYDKVLNRIIPNATSNRYSSTDIVEWAAPDKSLVRLDPNAAFFKAEDVGELVHNYGDNTIRSAYFKTIGGYLGFEDLTAPDDDVVNGCLTLCASKDDVKPIFTRIFSNSATRSRNRAESVLDYGDGVDPAETDYNVTNQSRVIDTNPNGEFIMSNRVPYYVWLYKLAEPYNISTEVYDAAAAAAGCNLTIEQTFGVLGTTALDGVTVTITPESVGGYVLDEIKYYTINGSSGKTLDKNLGGSYSFTMPVGDVTVKAIFKKGDYYNITTECYPPEGGVITVQPKAAEGQTVFFSVTPNPGYAFDNELGGWPLKFYIRNENDEFEEFEPNNLQYLNINNGTMRFEMPDADVKIVAFFETGYTVTTVVNPPEGGHFRTSSDESIGFVNTFAEGSNVYVDLWPNKNPNYEVKSVVLTYTIDGEQYEEVLEGEPGDPEDKDNAGWMLYDFEMPAAHVTVTANLELNSPLSYVECPIGDNKYAPLCDDHVIVTDNLIGVWAVKNLLWAKDQSPQVSNDEVKRPDGTIDYLRQNFKLQKKPWDQSNWVILDFSKTEGWTGSESDYIEVEKYVDHQIKGGSIHGIYSCDGDDYKGKNKIILDEKPVVITPEDPNSLGYPGYLADPREQDPNYDYMYNHYIPANFIQDNIGGRFGGAGENGAIPGNEDYKDLRMFFMNPKDQEVAQVWAVWYGTMEFTSYDNWYNEVKISGDVFKIYESSIVGDGENEVSYNLYDFKGAFYVPSWKYNRLSSDRNDYGKPDGSGGHDALEKHNEYLFHVAIMTKGTEYMIVSKAPKRADGPLAQEDSYPWDHYEVYPLDLEPSTSVVTAVHEIAAPASTEIVSIRYYNVMGQESKTPFDGINIEVIRYKDGSMISNKVLK
jgi:hypothetical protein